MKNDPSDLHLQVTLFAHETKKLERAHEKLKSQFDRLRLNLDSSHQTLKEIINHMTDGLVFVNQTGIISLYNPAAAGILEISQRKALNSSYWNLFSDTFFGFSLSNALKTGKMPGRVILSISNGREVEAAPTLIKQQGVLLLLNDRTKLKQLEKSVQLNDRLKELGEMAATLAHEIRNPLGGIEGFTALLKRDETQPEKRKIYDAILQGTRTLNTLITNILDYSRPLTLHFVPTDLSTFLSDTTSLAEANGFPCTIKIEKEHVALIDPKRMQLVLLNLIRNSYEAQASHVEVVLTHTGQIQVIDRGNGIEQEILEKIFTPFFTTKSTGTGLGLSEACKVMRAHGGSITIDSKVGKGTCITLEYDDSAHLSCR